MHDSLSGTKTCLMIQEHELEPAINLGINKEKKLRVLTCFIF